jgi:hypothetical protein
MSPQARDVGFRRLKDLKRKGLLGKDDPSPAAFAQAKKQKACEPCVLGKLRRVLHPLQLPRHVRPLHRCRPETGLQRSAIASQDANAARAQEHKEHTVTYTTQKCTHTPPATGKGCPV